MRHASIERPAGHGACRIEKVESLVVDCYRTNWVFVKVTTRDGLTGVGEASLQSNERAVVRAVDELSRLVVGQDAFAIEGLHLRMQRDSYWRAGRAPSCLP